MRAVLPVVGVGALVMGFLALPGPEERITMLLRDGKTIEAQQALESLYRAGNRRPHILLQLAMGEDAAGRPLKSISYYEEYVATRPTDTIPLQRLADLYRVSGQLDKSLSAHERVVKLAPTMEGADRLLALYHLHGRVDAEERLLRALMNTPYIKAESLSRLAAIAANQNDLETASTALTLFDERSDVRGKAPRMMHFHVLVDQGRYADAFEKALNWSKVWRDVDCAIGFVLAFARLGQDEQARELTRRLAVSFRDFQFSAADALSMKGHANTARLLLDDWISETIPSQAKQARRYVQLSRQLGALAAPHKALFKLARTPGNEMTAMLLAEAIADTSGAASLAPLRALFSPRMLRKRPLFAAKLAIAEGNTDLARRYYALAQMSQLTADDRNTWIDLGNKLDPSGTYETLIHAWRGGHLAPEFRIALADMAYRRQDWQMHDAALRASGQPQKLTRLSRLNR